MAKVPFPPFSKRLLAPKIGNGMDSGPTDRKGNTVWHTMVGTLSGTDAWFRRPEVAAATNWGIGGSLDGDLDGVIYQWVEIPGSLIPWASGPWIYPGEGDGLKYVNTWGVYGINAYADSIEFSGQPTTKMTLKQWLNGMWLTAAIIHAANRDSEQFLWNMHHVEFCTRKTKLCPFARIANYTLEYQQGITYILQHYEGKLVPDTVSVAGLNVPLPLGKATVDPIPMPDKPIFVAIPPQQVVLRKGATLRQYGSTTSKVYRVVDKPERPTVIGYYHGESVHGSDKWYVLDSKLHERVHESGLVA